MRVLSLFDGMSCWMLAFQKAGIFIDEYFASEIDKFAIQVSTTNFPSIKQIEDIRQVNHSSLDNKPVDILIGGSCCQNFSQIGNRQGLEWEKSSLFYDYLRILQEVKPKCFLFENVRITKKWEDMISDLLCGIRPVEINSNLVSAQNRVRLYWVGKRNEDWTCFQLPIELPEDKHIQFKDILEPRVDAKYASTKRIIDGFRNKPPAFRKRLKIAEVEGKALCLCAKNEGTTVTQNYILCKREDWDTLLTDVSNTEVCWYLPDEWTYDMLLNKGKCLRKLTPTECERLQTVTEWYTSMVSNSQRYKMLGNGWTVDVIAHIFQQMFK